MLFDQFKHHNGSTKWLDFKCRFKSDKGDILGEERNMTRVSEIEYICVTPPSKYVGLVDIEIRHNEWNWQAIGK